MENMKIGEFSKRISVTPETIRKWHKQGFLEPAYVTPNGTRFYTQEQVDKYLHQQCETTPLTIGYCRENAMIDESLHSQLSCVAQHVTENAKQSLILVDNSNDLADESKLHIIISMALNQEVSHFVYYEGSITDDVLSIITQMFNDLGITMTSISKNSNMEVILNDEN